MKEKTNKSIKPKKITKPKKPKKPTKPTKPKKPTKPTKATKPKKRGRKPKNKTNVIITKPKKRGRKPKGGKIVTKESLNEKQNLENKPNIILQLKCFTRELNNNLHYFSLPNNNIESWNINSKKNQNMNYENFVISYPVDTSQEFNNSNDMDDDNCITNKKEIWNKLRLLKYKLHNNDVSDKKSDCFWCTYPFSNPPIFIPRHHRKGTVEVYGCFCSPECAVAFLKNELIDSTTRWERYALLNNIYGQIYDYKKNIKPAPNPFYTLDKYYGNLSIQEYRKLLLNDRLLLVVDKPLTKIMPELYEENNEIPMVYSDILSELPNKNKIKKFRLQRNKKKTSKKSILKEKFNI